MNNKGVTLVELVIVVTLMSIIILTATSLLDFGQKSFKSIERTGHIQTEAENIAAYISSKVRESKDITNVITSTMTVIDKDNNSVRIELINTELRAIITPVSGTPSTRILSENAESVSFYSITNGVRINLLLSSGGQKYEMSTSVYKRLTP